MSPRPPGLAHDLGHPPFGHVAEEKLNELVGDPFEFEGNAQSFRIVTKLEPHHPNYRGLDLTRSTLNGLLKYPFPRYGGPHKNPKFGFYAESEEKDFEFARAREAPSSSNRSLEAEIMDFADDVTFAVHDTEDFYRAGMIPLHELYRHDGSEFPRLIESIPKRWEEQGRPAVDDWEGHVEALREVLSNLVSVNTAYRGSQEERIALRVAAGGIIGDYVVHGVRVANAESAGSRIQLHPAIRMQIKMLKELVWEYVIDRPSLATQQAGHKVIVEKLFEHFKGALDAGRLQLLPPQFAELVLSRDVAKESNARLAADMICSLTDRQALILYRRITGLDPGAMAPFAL